MRLISLSLFQSTQFSTQTVIIIENFQLECYSEYIYILFRLFFWTTLCAPFQINKTLYYYLIGTRTAAFKVNREDNRFDFDRYFLDKKKHFFIIRPVIGLYLVVCVRSHCKHCRSIDRWCVAAFVLDGVVVDRNQRNNDKKRATSTSPSSMNLYTYT